MKLGAMNALLPASVADADLVFVYSENLGWDAGAVFAPTGTKARTVGDFGGLVEAIDLEARAGDHIVVMSNGAFGGIHKELLERLARSPGPIPPSGP